MIPAAVHDESIAISCAGRGDHGDGVVDGHVPRQTGSFRVRRSRNRVGAGHIYCAVRFRSLSTTPRTACSVADSGVITVSPTFTM
jgi:hypothetical protein